MTQETDTLVPDDAWIDDEDGARPDDHAFADEDAFADGDQIGEDDLDGSEPPARARRRSVPPIAIGLSAVVIAGLGFIGGVQVQKRSGGESGGGMPAGMAAMMPAGGPGGGAEGARGGAGSGGSSGSSSATTGEVANVTGSKVYVTTADGSTVEVSVGKKATVQRLAEADANEIRPGDTVVVSGTTADDGSVKATAVQATANGVSLLGGFGGRGGGPSAAGGSAAGSGSASGSSTSSDSGAGSASDSSTTSDTPSDDDAVDQLFESGD